MKIIPVGNQLGEGVQWHDKQQAIWWTDIEGCCLYRYCESDGLSSEQLASNKLTRFDLPERASCFAFFESSSVDNSIDEQMLVAFASGIALYKLSTGSVQWLSRPESALIHNRFNDGRVDRQGRFWAGTMVESDARVKSEAKIKGEVLEVNSAALYCLSHNQLTKKLSDIQISNGLCWSPDGSVLYHADSPKRLIHCYDFDKKSANLTHKQIFVETDDGCYPDGSAIDSAGYLWNAQWGGSKVVRYNKNGDVDFELPLPVSQPSCLAFGGPNLSWLIVTSAKQGLTPDKLTQEKHAGDVFIYQLDHVTGIKESLIKRS